MIEFLIGLAIGAIGGLAGVYFIYQNNKKKIDELVKVVEDLGGVI